MTVTLPFTTPRDIETAAMFVAELSRYGVPFEATSEPGLLVVHLRH